MIVKKENIKIMQIDELSSGMIIKEDILSDQGNVLIHKDFKIHDQEKIKEFLSKHGIYNKDILVQINEEEESVEMLKQRDIEKFKTTFDESRNMMKTNVEKLVKGENIEREKLDGIINNFIGFTEKTLNVFQLMQKVKDESEHIYTHLFDVMIVSYIIGNWMGLGQEQLDDLCVSALLSDIGKHQIDQELLDKAGKLDEKEELLLKKHVIHSFNMVRNSSFINDNIKNGILYHHERVDGSGYPKGLNGDQIPVFAKIIAIADIYTALIEERAYRSKLTPFIAMRIMESNYKEKLDIEILYIFLRKIGDKYLGSKVLLNNGEEAEIIFMPRVNIYRPIVKVISTSSVLDLGVPEYKELEIVEVY